MAEKVSNTPSLPSGFVPQDVVSLSRGYGDLVKALFNEFVRYASRVNGTLPKDGSEPMTGPVVLPSYTVAGVPSASVYARGMIYVSNETGGAVPAFSDGTNWRRVTDRAIVS